MANLLESYKGRIAVSEKFYQQQNEGAKMSSDKKLVLASCLQNTSRFINEAFENSVGTQRSDLGKFKTFCLDITTLTTPNLIVNDLLLVKPMSSITGYLTYMSYALGTEKGQVGGEAEADPFGAAMSQYGGDTWNAQTKINDYYEGFGKMSEDRARYTSERIVEAVATAGDVVLAWGPIAKGKVDVSGVACDVKIVPVSGTETAGYVDNSGAKGTKNLVYTDAALTTKYVGVVGDKMAYIYDNQYAPQDKLPTVVGRMQGIALAARARRIAVAYSQLAAYQA